ncbi:zinc knuckle, partial [Ostertagia ostertagi]
MSDNIERELDYILEQDVARDSRIEGFQQELLELRAQVLRLTQQNQQKVLSSVSQCNLMLTKLQKLPKIRRVLRGSLMLRREIVEKELDKLLESQCRAMRTALDLLSEFANRVTEAASEAHAKHDEELDEIIRADTASACSTEKVKTVCNLVDRQQVNADRHVPSTSAQADAEQTPMETEQIETQQSDFRKAFELLKANDLSTDVALQPIEFDAVTAAEGEPLSRQAHSYGPRQFVDRTPFQMNVSVTEPLRPMEQPSPVRGNPSKGLSPTFSETSFRFENGVGATLAAMALPEVKNFSNPDGEGFVEFVFSFSKKYGRIGLPDDMLIHLMSEKLEGYPSAVMKALPEESKHGKFADFVAALKVKFAENTSAERLESHVKLKQLKMTKSVTEYCVQLESLTRKANPSASEADLSMARASELVSQITNCQGYFQLFAFMEIERNKKVAAATRSASELKQVNEQSEPRRSFPFQKVEESADRARNLENLAQRIERNKKAAAATRSASELKQVNEQRKPRRSFPFQKVEESADRARNVQNRSQDSGEQSSQSPIQHDSLPPQADRGFCRICKKPGHLLRDCDKRQQGAGQQNSEHAPNNACPKQPKRTFTTVLGNWSCLTSGLHHSKNEMFGSKTMCNVQLLGFTRRALVDTGSRVSILPLSILLDAKEAGFDLDADVEEVKMEDRIKIYDASGRKMAFKGNDDTIVLGTNILGSVGTKTLLEPSVQLKRHSVSVRTSSSHSKTQHASTQTIPLKEKGQTKPLKSDAIAKARTETKSLSLRKENKVLKAAVVARVYLKSGETKTVSIAGSPSDSAQILWSNCDLIPHAVCRSGQALSVPLTNITGGTRIFRAGEKVGFWDQSLIVEKSPVDCANMLERTSAPINDRWKILVGLLQENKSEGSWNELLENKVQHFQDVFAVTDQELTQTHVVEHDIQTGAAKPKAKGQSSSSGSACGTTQDPDRPSRTRYH